MSRDELDSAACPDRSRGRGNDITPVAGFAGSSVPHQPVFRIVKRIGGSTHIENITARPDQEPDPAGPGDLSRSSIWDYCACVHGAIVFRDRIRHKDKAPSFSAKQTRAKDDFAESGMSALGQRRNSN